MKKLILLTFLFILLSPTQLFAAEKLFYFFNNEYGLSSFKSNSRKIDIVAPQIYVVDDQLKIDDVQSKKILQEIKKKKVDAMPLVVNKGFSKPLMTRLLNDEKAQDEIIKFLIKEGKKKGYIGWQFDFENINHLDRDLYTKFVAKTYDALKEEGFKFSVAVVVRSDDYNPNSTIQDWSSAYDYEKLSENSDFLSLMTYDDPNSIGPVASIPYVTGVLDYMITKAPSNKLSLGIPLYCWKWQDGIRAGSTTRKLAQKAYIKGKNRIKYFDQYYGAELYSYKIGDLPVDIWCENDKSVAMKLKLINDYDLRGFSAWALGQDDKVLWKALIK